MNQVFGLVNGPGSDGSDNVCQPRCDAADSTPQRLTHRLNGIADGSTGTFEEISDVVQESVMSRSRFREWKGAAPGLVGTTIGFGVALGLSEATAGFAAALVLSEAALVEAMLGLVEGLVGLMGFSSELKVWFCWP